jgi:hypothetical protein
MSHDELLIKYDKLKNEFEDHKSKIKLIQVLSEEYEKELETQNKELSALNTKLTKDMERVTHY